jgi:hypothetical protein
MLIIMLYDFNSINHPNLMGARRSCGHDILPASNDGEHIIIPIFSSVYILPISPSTIDTRLLHCTLFRTTTQ